MHRNSNSSNEDAHLDATLKRIDQLANEDVEMQGPPMESVAFVVLDTNILLNHLEVIERFVTAVASSSLPVIVIIPGAVIGELDGQKNREGLAWFARRASAWLLKKVRERKHVKGQANEETCKRSGNWKIRDGGEKMEASRLNDYLIYDCCLYFSRVKNQFVLLCSGDKNLCIECESVGIKTTSPTRHWSSRDIARAIFGNAINQNLFEGFHLSYKNRENQKEEPRAEDQGDGMDVDDEFSSNENLHPSHALDLIHVQVVEHFTQLLVELVGRVGGPEIHETPPTKGEISRYAPGWSTKPYLSWTAKDSLEYLDTKKRIPPSNPRLEYFLAKPYGPGSRRGQDWSRRDWEISLKALSEVGEMWREISIKESLGGLYTHLTVVFAQPMRPTGI